MSTETETEPDAEGLPLASDPIDQLKAMAVPDEPKRDKRHDPPVWVHHTCSECGRDIPRDGKLYAKTATWRVAGRHGAYVQSRSVAYQCRDCVLKDEDWHRQPYRDSAGMSTPPKKRNKKPPTLPEEP